MKKTKPKVCALARQNSVFALAHPVGEAVTTQFRVQPPMSASAMSYWLSVILKTMAELNEKPISTIS
jgi:hypothetical protein